MKKLLTLFSLLAVLQLSARITSAGSVVSAAAKTNLLVPFDAAGDTNKMGANNMKQGFWIERTGAYDWEGNYIDGKREGTWVAYPVGTPMVAYIDNYRGGKKNGISLGVDRAGYIFRQESFVDDSLEGMRRTFFTGGRLKTEEVYKNGKLNGYRKIYNNNNKIQEEGNFKNGMRDGIAKWYYTDGKLNTESVYKDGNLEGKMITYHSNGNKASEVIYRMNEMEGEYVEYHESGKLKTKGTYVHSLEEGAWSTMYESGKVYESGKFVKGKREGAWSQMSEDGKTSAKLKYKNGEVISGTPMQAKPLPAPPAQPAAPTGTGPQGKPNGQATPDAPHDHNSPDHKPH
ncbi:MAG: toxin-antitoxin system YwqK family antitoxin [Bacteroidota bacterium]|nr:toxin-antitoxin system YwqK family antitoxin [Bacteroidota bacterium]